MTGIYIIFNVPGNYIHLINLFLVVLDILLILQLYKLLIQRTKLWKKYAKYNISATPTLFLY